jgi:hypothetical protein
MALGPMSYYLRPGPFPDEWVHLFLGRCSETPSYGQAPRHLKSQEFSKSDGQELKSRMERLSVSCRLQATRAASFSWRISTI